MREATDLGGAALLLLHEPGLGGAFVADALARLARSGLAARAHELSGVALESDRRAPLELDRALDALAGLPGVERERLGLFGFGRGGTLAFLHGCKRRLAALVDVEGPVLHAALAAERPIQPLELALNLEGAFLGLFAQQGAVGGAELELLRARLTATARPFELVVLAGAAEGFFDPRAAGYDGAATAELWRRVLAFLGSALAAQPE